ncbi:MAG TPA: LuxR C-terminal-related transcriptional regulator, partial [Crinalium sp.]
GSVILRPVADAVAHCCDGLLVVLQPYHVPSATPSCNKALLVTRGMSNSEISAALRISESTVKSNINHILSKLGVKDRTQAVIIALKRGIAIL